MKACNPPLPEPYSREDRDISPSKWFTEAQLLAYREAVIEMCAKAFEGEFTEGNEDIALSIRSLK